MGEVTKEEQLRAMREARYETPVPAIVTPEPIVTPNVTGNRHGGRARQYASNAERQRAYRQRNANRHDPV